ncbi:hypothetical protein ACQKM2_15780 [Streptomyces sp. NPDC004126]|uniref:hypothetical protein n=1 Tax=Streptomyces sp. NPDC004126 TaxID=3390695 RepID=UPI003D05E167
MNPNERPTRPAVAAELRRRAAPVQDPERLDERRAAMGLEPAAAYAPTEQETPV